MHSRRVRAALVVAAAIGTAGCGDGLAQACPAIGYGTTVVARLDGGWPAGVHRAVQFVCDPVCASPVLLEDVPPASPLVPGTSSGTASPTTTPPPTPADPVVEVDGAGRASLGLWGERPAVLTVRVLEAGSVVAEVTAELDFVRVDGTEECGGNAHAEVVVPAP